MAYTASQINSIFQAVLQRPADLAAIQAFAGSSQSDAQVRTQIESSNEATVNVNPIVRLYQGAFGRLPDTQGLQGNYNQYINGYNATQLAQNFLNSSEGVAKFGANVTVTAGFVSTLYTQALNRTAGASEISYWTGTGKSAAQVLSEISNSSEAVNKEAVPILTFLDSAAQASVGQGTVVTGSLYNQTPTNLTFTTGSDAIVGSANNDTLTAVGANVNAGDTIDSGAGIDSLTIDGNIGGLPGTISNLEVITFANRTAALTLDLTKAAGLSLATIRNSTTIGDTIALKSGEVAGLDNVKVALNAGPAAAETFTFDGTSASLAVANGTNINATGNTVALNGANVATVNVLSTGSANNTIGSLTSTGTAVKTLNISGDKGLTLATTITALTTIDASANNAGVKFTGTETGLTSAKFGTGNDSFLTGDSFVAGNAASTATIDGGAGLDYIGANAGSLTALLSSTNKVTGFEVLEVTSALTAAANTTYDLSKIAGLGSIQFDAATTSAANVTTFSGLTSGGSITFGADVVSGTGGAAVTGTAANLVFNVTGAGTNTNDTETVFFTATANGATAAAHTVGAFTLQGVENLVLNNRDASGALTTFYGVADAQLQSITLQSTAVDANGAAAKASALVLGGATSGFTSAIISNLDATGYGANVDATGIAGQLSATGATLRGGAGVFDVKGGVGTDTITVGVGGGAVDGGAGVDTINLSAATTAGITLTQTGVTGTVLDVVNVTPNTATTGSVTGSATAATADSVTGFHLGSTAATSDVLAFNGAVALGADGTATFTAATAAAANVAVIQGNTAASGTGNTGSVTVAITSGFATVTGATGNDAVAAVQNYLNSGSGGTNKVAALVVGSDTYVIDSGATAGTANGTTVFGTGDDYVVKLAGLSTANALSTTGFGTTTIHIG